MTILILIACVSASLDSDTAADTADSTDPADTAPLDTSDTDPDPCPAIYNLPTSLAFSYGTVITIEAGGCGTPSFACPMLGGKFDAPELPANLTLYMLSEGSQYCSFMASDDDGSTYYSTIYVEAIDTQG